MSSKQSNCKRLQGAADARRRARRRTFVLQVPDNKADAVPCERLPYFKLAQGLLNLLVLKAAWQHNDSQTSYAVGQTLIIDYADYYHTNHSLFTLTQHPVELTSKPCLIAE
jgi:hypothetical protein